MLPRLVETLLLLLLLLSPAEYDGGEDPLLINDCPLNIAPELFWRANNDECLSLYEVVGNPPPDTELNEW
jgi:hypothetical protein